MSELRLTHADDGQTRKIPKNDYLVIELEENPTTGYRWAIDVVDDDVLVLRSSELILPPDPMIGGGGTRVFSFEAKAVGTTPIRLKKWREWEGDDSVIDRFGVTVSVTE
jgi:inhibitor of cysteine peptidase